MTGYYDKKLAGVRLRRCYEIASPRIRQYLEAEIAHVIGRLRPEDVVLELGVGYGRVADRLATVVRRVVGIDTAEESLALARDETRIIELAAMDASRLGFRPDVFDAVVCVQNGIAAFGVDRLRLVREAARVTAPGGRLIFSTYARRFWHERLAWFEAQAKAGLVGEIDHAATREGTIVCRDGFTSGDLSEQGFLELMRAAGVAARVNEVDGSSLICEAVVAAERRA